MTALLQIACQKVISDPKPTVKDLIHFIDQHEQIDVPVTHTFVPDKKEYWREITMPSGMTGVGHVHKQRHFNIVLSGRALVTCDGVTRDIKAPFIFESMPGAQKAFHVIKDFRLITVHQNPDNLTDVVEVERLIFDLPEEVVSAGVPLNDFRMQKNQLKDQE